jgi:hypothetical protein
VRIDLVERLQELLAQGAQLLEVLPEEEYRRSTCRKRSTSR